MYAPSGKGVMMSGWLGARLAPHASITVANCCKYPPQTKSPVCPHLKRLRVSITRVRSATHGYGKVRINRNIADSHYTRPSLKYWYIFWTLLCKCNTVSFLKCVFCDEFWTDCQVRVPTGRSQITKSSSASWPEWSCGGKGGKICVHVCIEARRQVRSQRDERQFFLEAKVAGRRVAGRGRDASRSQAFKAFLLRRREENEDGRRNVGWGNKGLWREKQKLNWKKIPYAKKKKRTK